ncbi:DUF3846 domain-containing protein [Streptomyces actinomycinicus]|uniref:DUF3846 domain-containing protein n=1 Tax=Streptomyces actinomycinicus TaxID=1695166 RepID=A0A937ERH4_9ACTN|nr:DUF3846 domain-containing protein [Streptomyces actinomycinicus]MBL1086866.1 DUF3846 domain-containing protein [Streptomyces actinomycinicus]
MSPITTTASDDQHFALIIQPTGNFRLLAWLPVSTPHHALCCDNARPVDLTTALTLWVDQDAAAYRQQPNRAAHGLIALYRPTPLPYLGDVVLTGTPDADGNPHGLSHTQALALVDLYLDTATVHLMPRPRS